MKNTPWTDLRRNQEKYFSSVRLWSAYHDALSQGNSNRAASNLWAIVLKSQLYVRPRDLCSWITDAQSVSKQGLSLIVSYVYKYYALIGCIGCIQGF